MHIDFSNKTIIVTGGSNGIGKEISEMFLNLNANVIITGTNTEPAWCASQSKCQFYKLDFLDPSSFTHFSAQLKKRERIDILINNAGIQIKHPIDKIDDNDWNKVIAINLTGPMKMMRLVVPIMKTQSSGNIINISSVAGIISKPNQSSYSATKAGLIGLTKASALDLVSYNISVNVLCPGTTQTPMVEKLLSEKQKKIILENVPMKRFADVSEIARFVMFLCSKYNTFMTGQAIILDGGFTVQ